MVSKIWILGFALGASALVASCAADHEVDAMIETCVAEASPSAQGDGGSAASAGQGGQGGTGGANATPECTAGTAEKDCAHLSAPNPQCGSVQCIENKCALQITPGPIQSQKYGDCKQVACDDGGNLIELNDASDFYNDGNQCTLDYCKFGDQKALIPIRYTFADGTPCPESGEGYCYQGKCVECIDLLPQATCNGAGMVCDSLFWCVSGLDCMGKCGGNCAPCAVGQVCIEGADCLSAVCTNGMCQFPSCTDSVKNDGETGTDCGAPSCGLCPAGEGCELPENCESGVCMLGICQASSCTDGTINGDEEGIDCGGSCSVSCVAPSP